MTTIKVAVRVRPLNDEEKKLNSKVSLEVHGNSVIVTDYKVPEHPKYDDHRLRVRNFAFDYCFWSVDARDKHYASQQMVYDKLGTAVLEALLQGYNACVFSYGQTGSGKTFTMMGKPEQLGITPRICQGLFSQIAGNQESKNVSFQTDVSFMEIYNEKVYDLLKPPSPYGSKPRLRVREHPICGPFVEGLTTLAVNDVDMLLNLLKQGNENRSLAATQLNERSSRSHAIFTICVTQAFLDQDRPSEVISKLHLVDLAGSEKANPEFCQARIKEGGSINKSLVTLGNVISSLAENTKAKKSSHIPYRDSLLTWLLRDTLGGNALTFMIATVSPSYTCFNETLNTLRYAERTKKIVNRPLVNEDPRTRLLCNLKDEVSKLKNWMASSQLKIAFNTLCTPGFLADIIEQNEEKVERWTQSWIDKWCDSYSVNSESSTMKEVQSWDATFCNEVSWPYLLYWEMYSPNTEITLYPLQEGNLCIGSKLDTTSQHYIELNSPFILPKHCTITTEKTNITLNPEKESLCRLNGAQIMEPFLLKHGDTIILGQSSVFYFNHLFVSIKSNSNMVSEINEAISELSLISESEVSLSENKDTGKLNTEMQIYPIYAEEIPEVADSVDQHEIQAENGDEENVASKDKHVINETTENARCTSFDFLSFHDGLLEEKYSGEYDALYNCDSLYLLDEALLMNSSFSSIPTYSQNDLRTSRSSSIDVQQTQWQANEISSIHNFEKIEGNMDESRNVNKEFSLNYAGIQKEMTTPSQKHNEGSTIFNCDSTEEANLPHSLPHKIPQSNSENVPDTLSIRESLKLNFKLDMKNFLSKTVSDTACQSVSLPVTPSSSMKTNENQIKYSLSFPQYDNGNNLICHDLFLTEEKYKQIGIQNDFDAPLIPNELHEDLSKEDKCPEIAKPEPFKFELHSSAERKSEVPEFSIENNNFLINFEKENSPLKKLPILDLDDDHENIMDSLEQFNINALSSNQKTDNHNSSKSSNFSDYQFIFDSESNKQFEENEKLSLLFSECSLDKNSEESLNVMDVSIDSIEPEAAEDISSSQTRLFENVSVESVISNEQISGFQQFDAISDFYKNIYSQHGENNTSDNQAKSPCESNPNGFYLEIAQSSSSNSKTSWSLLSQNLKNVNQNSQKHHSKESYVDCVKKANEPLDSLDECCEEEEKLEDTMECDSLLSRSSQEYHFLPYKNKDGKPVAGVLWKTDCIPAPGSESVTATIQLPSVSTENDNMQRKLTPDKKNLYLPLENTDGANYGNHSVFQSPSKKSPGQIVSSSSTESLDSSISSDSITYIFVGPTSQSKSNVKGINSVYESNPNDSQTEGSISNYTSEGINTSYQRRHTYCSLSADSLDCRADKRTVNTCSPRTLSVDSLILEEGLARLQDDELTKFLNEWKEKTLAVKANGWQETSSGGKDNTFNKQVPSPICQELYQSNDAVKFHHNCAASQNDQKILNQLPTNCHSKENVKADKKMKKFGSAHSDPFPSTHHKKGTKVHGLSSKNRSYPCHSTPRGGSLNLEQITNCPLLPSIFETRAAVPRRLYNETNAGIAQALNNTINCQHDSEGNSERELDRKVLDILGDVVGIVGKLVSKNSIQSSSETVRSKDTARYPTSDECMENNAGNTISCKESLAAVLKKSRKLLADHKLTNEQNETQQPLYSGDYEDNFYSNKETVASMVEEVDKLRKERISFAQMLSSSASESQANSHNSIYGMTSGCRASMDKLKRTHNKRSSSNLPQRRMMTSGNRNYNENTSRLYEEESILPPGQSTFSSKYSYSSKYALNSTSQSPSSYLHHLLDIRRHTVRASSSAPWKEEEVQTSCEADLDSESDIYTRSRSSRLRNRKHRSSKHDVYMLQQQRCESASNTSSDEHLGSSASLSESSCDCRAYLNSSSSWNSRCLINELYDKSKSQPQSIATPQAKSSQENRHKLMCQMSTDSGACCSSSPVSTTKEVIDLGVAGSTPLHSSSRACKSRNSHRNHVHRDRTAVSKSSLMVSTEKKKHHYSDTYSENQNISAFAVSTFCNSKDKFGSNNSSDLDFDADYKPIVLKPSSPTDMSWYKLPTYQPKKLVPNFYSENFNNNHLHTKSNCHEGTQSVLNSDLNRRILEGCRSPGLSKTQNYHRTGYSVESLDDDWFPSDTYHRLPNFFSKDNCRHLICS